MTQLRLFVVLAVLIVAFALPAAALAHPDSEGQGYCRFSGRHAHVRPLQRCGPRQWRPRHTRSFLAERHSSDFRVWRRSSSSSERQFRGRGRRGRGAVRDRSGPTVLSRMRPRRRRSALLWRACKYWFIGADGSAQPGPYLPDSPRIERYEGTNPLTGKSVVIDYVVEGEKDAAVGEHILSRQRV